jgi:hypothetical protein
MKEHLESICNNERSARSSGNTVVSNACGKRDKQVWERRRRKNSIRESKVGELKDRCCGIRGVCVVFGTRGERVLLV